MKDEWIDIPEFMARTPYKETAAKAIFKNSHLVRAGILVKFTPPGMKGGWCLDWRKFLEYSKNNAADALRIIV